MYRYQGEDNVNNYICFGTIDKDKCTSGGDSYGDGIDKYMYRIIGVTPEGELALIKETFVKEGDETLLQWNDKDTTADCGSDGSLCTWANSKLYNRLNGLCKEGNTNCAGTISSTYGDSNIFIGNSYYEYLTNGSVWLDKISNHRWKYGESKKLDSYNGDNAYSIESQFSNSIDEAKIGLMYVHDFYYAYPGGNPENKNTAKNAWIHFQKDGYNNGIGGDWLITKFGLSYLVYAWSIWSNGYLSSDDPMSNPREVRPVFYLTPDIIIKEGTTGEKDNPYIIDIEREYEYTGTPQEFVAPKDGYYQIELWGASGGGYAGGKGAYTKGIIKLDKDEILYVYVGEHPDYVSGNCYMSNPNTSFNGSTLGSCVGGGGATDVRLSGGDWYNFDGLKSRIMVAAGGGGAYYEYEGYGGYGSALTGGAGEGYDSNYSARAGAGANQQKYQFGNASTGDLTCIAGNGYYSGEFINGANAGGGSSFISGYPSCKAIDKDSTEDHIISLDTPNHYSGKVFTDYEMIPGNEEMPTHDGLSTMTGNTGNGFAKITYIGASK